MTAIAKECSSSETPSLNIISSETANPANFTSVRLSPVSGRLTCMSLSFFRFS
ncbi:hypothetical protein [Allobaculum mucilyticum]|uniref:hypothetical protein n=1 Tax=Allobaculum mucilyticum TaxID=2834459 RepID=UPI001F61E2C5|nr:hypothetical protein [Allobaculum mucilyticum]UNT96462.1 hypothetical protein KWG62_01485 [Allobaculum mucilyticum]